MESLRATLAAIEGVEKKASRFNGSVAFWVGGMEIAHFDAADVVDIDVVDIRLTAPLIRARRSELRANPAVTLRASSSADWLEVSLKTADDERLCIELVDAAARAHSHRVVSFGNVPKHNDAPGPRATSDS
jgi:hypothetical protein